MSVKKPPLKAEYQAVIVGAGRIAAGFDTPTSREVLTHAHAYSRHSKINLAGFFDIDMTKAKKAALLWGGRAFVSLAEMFRETQPDLVSICTPDADHLETLKQVAVFKPKLVICEKPVTQTIADTKQIEFLYKEKNIPLLINYSRRFDPTVHKIKQQIVGGKWGNIISARGLYTKGILHSGSHLVDLARNLFGETTRVQSLTSRVDFQTTDPTIGGFLIFERCPEFYLSTGNDQTYGMFELDILAEKGRLRFTDFGFNLLIQKITADRRYKGFFGLGKELTLRTQLPRAMSAMLDNAINHLEKNIPLFCDISEALKTQQVCNQLSTSTFNL